MLGIFAYFWSIEDFFKMNFKKKYFKNIIAYWSSSDQMCLYGLIVV